MFLSHFGPVQSCASAGNVLTILLNEEHLTIYTRVLSTIGFWFCFYPEPTLFFLSYALNVVLFTVELYMSDQNTDTYPLYREVELHTLLRRPRFYWLFIAIPPLLVSLLIMSGLLTNCFYQRTITLIHLFYKFVNHFLK